MGEESVKSVEAVSEEMVGTTVAENSALAVINYVPIVPVNQKKRIHQFPQQQSNSLAQGLGG